jgi:hypothetical protein
MNSSGYNDGAKAVQCQYEEGGDVFVLERKGKKKRKEKERKAAVQRERECEGVMRKFKSKIQMLVSCPLRLRPLDEIIGREAGMEI